jgi:hypothetical protein
MLTEETCCCCHWLQGTVLVVSMDGSLGQQELAYLFSQFGDLKGVEQDPGRPNCRFVEFYDVRHAGKGALGQQLGYACSIVCSGLVSRALCVAGAYITVCGPSLLLTNESWLKLAITRLRSPGMSLLLGLAVGACLIACALVNQHYFPLRASAVPDRSPTPPPCSRRCCSGGSPGRGAVA